jgi:hypothetical protein
VRERDGSKIGKGDKAASCRASLIGAHGFERNKKPSKSSTIHSTSCWHRADEEVRDLLTLCPFELFLITAVPDVFEEAVTVMVTESPVLKEIPEKSEAPAGNHSYQAARIHQSAILGCHAERSRLTRVADGRALNLKVEPSLEDCITAAVAVDSNPG